MKCTLVSCYPQPIEEERNGIYPGRFKIPGAKRPGEINVLVIGDSTHYIDMGEDRPALPMTYSAEKIADSLVLDLIHAKPFTKIGVQQPCIFWVEGEFKVEEIRPKFGAKLDAHIAMQKAWFNEIIKIADEDWAKSPGSHRAISDDAKKACVWLGIEKQWAVDYTTTAKVSNCPFCTVQINELAIICPNCKQVVKKAEYDKLVGASK